MKNTRKSILSGLAALLMIAGNVPAFSGELTGTISEQIKQIQDAISQKGAKWVAGETAVTRLPKDQWGSLVGLNLNTMTGAPALAVEKGKAPAAIDWRNNNGNFVTPVRDQMKCGSCWAFGMTGTLESYVLINQHRPGENLDLAEQIMVSCSGIGSCQGGKLDGSYIVNTGLPLETVYPYTATDGTCGSATPGWEATAYKADKWGTINWPDIDAMKAAVAQYGPITTSMMVYEDFMAYKSGVYSYTTGKKLGGHAIIMVGYDDAEQAFICKNSWTEKWGDKGYFKVAYTEVYNFMATMFGIQTIAFQSNAAGKQMAPSFNADKAWMRVAPMFETLKANF
ncbi:MAG: C1 family peptidase [Elusimicrobiales bacterium]|jgi:C1A family cysteine protease